MADELGDEIHRQWLARHGRELLAFGMRSGLAGGGAAWLDDTGAPDASKGVHTWITARTVHVYGLGALLGVAGCADVAARALAGLTGVLHDGAHGGWHPSVQHGAAAPGKSCYDHVFVVLAAATATHAGIDGARALFDDATDVLLRYFWDDEVGRLRDVWDTGFTAPDPYRGLNANMHGVEALLAAASLTGDVAWTGRAVRVSRFVAATAAANAWRLPEHFDDRWRPLLDFNRDQPAHQFKPFGATVGHAFEWARLFVHLGAAPGVDEADAAELGDAAVQLFDRAVADGWSADGAPGFVYTTDWDGTPVVRDRLHWVLTEAIGAAAALHAASGEARYADWYHRWWAHAERYHLDREHGSWIHQLDESNQPAASVWSGKPDLYHAFQATLIPVLPRYPMMAAALAAAQA